MRYGRYGFATTGSNPDRTRAGSQRGGEDIDDVSFDRVRIRALGDTLGEPVEHLLGVVPGPEEAPVDRGLDTAPEGIEGGGGGQRRSSDTEVGVDRKPGRQDRERAEIHHRQSSDDLLEEAAERKQLDLERDEKSGGYIVRGIAKST